MPVYKSVEYSVYCDIDGCDSLEDYGVGRGNRLRSAEKTWRGLGWRHTKRGWMCPKHAKSAPSPDRAETGEEGETK